MAREAGRIRASREWMLAAMEHLPIPQVFPSRANFILFRVAPGCAGQIHQGLKAAGVLIKNLDGSHPDLADCLRVTVGTEAENHRFLEVLGPLLGVNKAEPD